jgi:thiamine phosphate synthase YjbQ (UPF0047 family)
VQTGLIAISSQGATVANMTQENGGQSVQNKAISLLKKLIPSGIWELNA